MNNFKVHRTRNRTSFQRANVNKMTNITKTNNSSDKNGSNQEPSTLPDSASLQDISGKCESRGFIIYHRLSPRTN